MIEHCISVFFVDDMDFVTEGTYNKNQMKQIIAICNQLYTATGEQIEFTKKTYFVWK